MATGPLPCCVSPNGREAKEATHAVGKLGDRELDPAFRNRKLDGGLESRDIIAFQMSSLRKVTQV
jgi:hypothetical protein